MSDPERQPVADDSSPAPFDAFRELAGRLIRVPKEEADAKEAEYQREQAKKPKRGPSPSGAPSPTLRPGNRSVRLSCEAITDG